MRYESYVYEKRQCTRYKIHKYYLLRYLFINQKWNGCSKVWDKRKIQWKILPEKQKIGEFEAQKASYRITGRKWTAWFTEEMPFRDALVINLEDYQD